MNSKYLATLCAFLALNLPAQAQKVYELDEPSVPKTIWSGHL